MVMFKLPCCWCMSHDVSTNWFFGISLKHRSTIHLSYDLVCNDNSYTKLNKKRAKLQPTVFPRLHMYYQMLEKCASIIVIIVFLANTLTGHITLHRGVLKNYGLHLCQTLQWTTCTILLWRRISHVVLHAIFKLCKLFIWAGLNYSTFWTHFSNPV